MNHFQLITALSIVDLKWDSDVKKIFEFFEYFSFLSENFVPAECIFYHIPLNYLTQKVIITNLVPILLSFIFFIFWCFISIISDYYWSIFKGDSISKALDKLQVSFFILFSLLFSEIVRKCLSLFSCILIDNYENIEVLAQSPDVICWEYEHLKYILIGAVPGLIIWAIITPFIMLKSLHKYRILIIEIIKLRLKNIAASPDNKFSVDSIKNSLKAKNNSNKQSTRRNSHKFTFLNFLRKKTDKKNDRSLTRHAEFNLILHKALVLKYLYKGYSPKFYYWEIIILAKKFILIVFGCVSDFFPLPLKGILTLLLFGFFLFTQIKFQPYQTLFLNRIEAFSLITVFIKASFGILMQTPELKDAKSIILIFNYLINASFLIYWSLMFWKYAFKQSLLFSLLNRVFLGLFGNRQNRGISPEPRVLKKKKINFVTKKND